MPLTNEDVALGRALPRWFDGEPRSESLALAAVEVLRGRRAVLAQRNLLIELSQRTGQAGVMDALEVWLGAPTASTKIPCLVLVGTRDATHPGTAADDLDGAVLLYEYTFAGRGTGVFATDDLNGERTVLAPAGMRAEIAEIACRTLLENGAKVALVALTGDTEAARRPVTEAGPACRIAIRKRLVPRYLPLAATFESTLATLGKHTRRNLRYYRRKLEADMAVQFVARVQMDREQFLAMNRASINPSPDDVAAWRYQSMAQLPDPIFHGLRSADGRWLSLVGGRRQADAVDIDWQMNLAGLPRYSLSTVMRAFLLEYEIAQGTRKLLFEGGTPHSMRHSFACTDAVDVIVERRCAKAWLLRRFARWIFPEKNFLGQALRDKDLLWTESQPARSVASRKRRWSES
jgi:hypothetical protein